MNQDSYRKLISGQKRGAGTAATRILLNALSPGYAVAVSVRNSLYDTGVLKPHKAEVPVISVGNITAGGTGKTPFVIRLAGYFVQGGFKTAILTRGYKSTQDPGPGTQYHTDEIEVLRTSCPDAKVIVNPDRPAAAEAAARQGCKVLILDDGFQHRKLARNLDIVVIDATRPFGYDRLLPAGLLREPVDSLRRADAVVITRTDQVTPEALGRIVNRIKQIKPQILLAESIHQPVGIKTADLKHIPTEQIRGKKVYAFCGIGNPGAFFDTIRQLGAELSGSQIFNDHHRYGNDELARIRQEAAASGADIILTTQKDWPKLPGVLTQGTEPAAACLEIELKITTGEDRLKELIERVLAGKISAP